MLLTTLTGFELGWTCVPLAVETYGNWGVEAQETFSRLASLLAASHSVSKSKATADIYGRLNLTLTRYLATCTDYFSKWPVAQALLAKSAEGVAHFVLSLITRFGCFNVCISDQGHEFVNALNDKRFKWQVLNTEYLELITLKQMALMKG
ncbi:hypothetical protein EMCRGX_G006179 [Ephydatia muelleri]